jgi:hypothetical protein
MRRAHLTKEERLLHGVFTLSLAVLAGCAPSQPIVVNPTEPWEDELARERQAAQASQTPQSSVARQTYDTNNEYEEGEEPHNSGVVVALTDIIAFPFRGAGWLAQQIF